MTEALPRIILTGFMCAGKTTVAHALARRLGCRSIDLDEFIAAREGRSISAIISEVGEQHFREIETRALRDALADKAARVIALGGGAWTLERNRAILAQHDCLTVWLDAPFELCWQRIMNDSRLRPLARDKEQTRTLYEDRMDSYALATLHLHAATEKSPDTLATEITAYFNQD